MEVVKRDVSSCVIRSVREGDFCDINLLCSQLGSDVTLEDIKYRCLSIDTNEDSILLVAEDSGELIGWIQAQVERKAQKYNFGIIQGLIVDKPLRRRGFGRALVEAVELWCSEKGCRSLRLCSGKDRKDAHKLFEGMGYAYNEKYSCFYKELKDN